MLLGRLATNQQTSTLKRQERHNCCGHSDPELGTPAVPLCLGQIQYLSTHRWHLFHCVLDNYSISAHTDGTCSTVSWTTTVSQHTQMAPVPLCLGQLQYLNTHRWHLFHCVLDKYSISAHTDGTCSLVSWKTTVFQHTQMAPVPLCLGQLWYLSTHRWHLFHCVLDNYSISAHTDGTCSTVSWTTTVFQHTQMAPVLLCLGQLQYFSTHRWHLFHCVLDNYSISAHTDGTCSTVSWTTTVFQHTQMAPVLLCLGQLQYFSTHRWHLFHCVLDNYSISAHTDGTCSTVSWTTTVFQHTQMAPVPLCLGQLQHLSTHRWHLFHCVLDNYSISAHTDGTCSLVSWTTTVSQ